MDIITPLQRLRAAYNNLEREVMRALQIQVGDIRRLSVTRERVLAFQVSAEQVSNLYRAFYQ